jgi:hypothetical protein
VLHGNGKVLLDPAAADAHDLRYFFLLVSLEAVKPQRALCSGRQRRDCLVEEFCFLSPRYELVGERIAVSTILWQQVVEPVG